MRSARSIRLTPASLPIVILMAIIAALLVATPNDVFAEAPDRPTGLTATADDHDTISLTWSHPDPSTVDHYRVLSRKEGSGAGQLTQTGTSTTTSFVDDGLDPDSTYFYRVKPVNSAGEEGQRSARAEATTDADEAPAPAPDPTPEPTPDPTPANPQRSDGGQSNIARSSHNVLVSNVGQTSENNNLVADKAQPFTTGTNTDGYVLTSVVVAYNDTNSDPFAASVWTTDAAGLPDTLKHSLTAPTTFAAGNLVFTAPSGATLDADTTYTVKLVAPSGTAVTLERTSTVNPDEDSGAAAGWSIADTYQFFETSSGAFTPSSSNKPHLIAVHGTVASSSNATLSALTVNDGSNNLTLTPSFRSRTYVYETDVTNAINTVTLTATPHHSEAEVTAVTLDGTAIADTDFTDGITVPSLAVNDNEIVVTVTAENTSTQTYTVTVTRASTLPGSADSGDVEYVYSDWRLKPSNIGGGEQFRLIFLSSTKRDATSTDINDYNDFVQDRAAAGHNAIRPYADQFKVVGCTTAVDARDNTSTTYTNNNKGVRIYWLNGAKVADDYEDFYDETWDSEANDDDRDERGDNSANINQNANFPWTGCEHDGTEAAALGGSEALGVSGSLVVGRPNTSGSDNGPLSSSQTEHSSGERPMYGLSQVFEVIQLPPFNVGVLTTGGTPRSETLDSNDNGNYWKAQLHHRVKYRIDVKGSEPSQYGGTISNPWLKLIAASDDIEVLNSSSARVSQNATEINATGGGAGRNARLDIRVTGDTRYYYMLSHRNDGDNGSYTITVNRLDWPQGRLAPDIEVTRENQTSIQFEWEEPAKTQDTLVAPLTGYKVQYRARPGGSWSAETTKNANQRSHEFTGLTSGQKYQIRVRAYHNNQASNNRYMWGYATAYTDDCAANGANACSITVNQTKTGRVNYASSLDQDSYRVRLLGGTTYVIEAKGKSTGNGTLVDPQLSLQFASDDSQAASNDDGGSGLDAKITYTPGTTLDYFIRVSPWTASDHGTYKVKVTTTVMTQRQSQNR